MQIIVCGNGALAGAVEKICIEALYQKHGVNGYSHFSADLADPGSALFDRPYGVTWIKGETVAVHAGSGRQLGDFISFCKVNCIPLIQASTGQKLPEVSSIPIIEAPNLALPILCFLKALPDFWKAFEPIKGMVGVSITESHQSTKKTVPGTALKMAAAFNVDKDTIHSVRDPKDQKIRDVQNLDRHGYHWINIHGCGVRIHLDTKIDGLDPYAHGALYLAEAILKFIRKYNLDRLSARLYEPTDFL